MDQRSMAPIFNYRDQHYHILKQKVLGLILTMFSIMHSSIHTTLFYPTTFNKHATHSPHMYKSTSSFTPTSLINRQFQLLFYIFICSFCFFILLNYRANVGGSKRKLGSRKCTVLLFFFLFSFFIYNIFDLHNLRIYTQSFCLFVSFLNMYELKTQ